MVCVLFINKLAFTMIGLQRTRSTSYVVYRCLCLSKSTALTHDIDTIAIARHSRDTGIRVILHLETSLPQTFARVDMN